MARFYEATVEGRALRSSAGVADADGEGEDADEDDSNMDNPDDDSDIEGRDYSWKKTIMIGPSYQVRLVHRCLEALPSLTFCSIMQASVPTELSLYDGDALPYENEDKLLWDPSGLDSDNVEDYLAKAQECAQHVGVASLPIGAHLRDDEQVLFYCDSGTRNPVDWREPQIDCSISFGAMKLLHVHKEIDDGKRCKFGLYLTAGP